MKYLLTPRYFFPLIFLFSIATFLAHTAFTKTAIFADGRFYYSITRSGVVDKDVNFANEYENLGVDIGYTKTGYVWNMYPPGVSLLWMPLFFIADGFSNLVNLGAPLGWITLDTSGFGIVYQTSVALSSIFLGTLGLYLVYRLLTSYFSNRISLLCILTLFATTNLLFYIAVEPITSHTASFFVSALFIYFLLRHEKDRHYYFILGTIGGIAGLVRNQDILILIIPAIKILFARQYPAHFSQRMRKQTCPKGHPALKAQGGLLSYKNNLKRLTTYFLQLTTGTLLGFLPQICFWKIIFGNFWYSPYLNVGFNFSKPQILYVLFNTQNGLFTITPIILFSLIGLLINLKKPHPELTEPRTLRSTGASESKYAIVYFLLQLYLISSWSNFFQGGSYSIRMMLTTYPLLSFGFASIIERSKKIFGKGKSVGVLLLFAALNMFLILRYLLLY